MSTATGLARQARRLRHAAGSSWVRRSLLLGAALTVVWLGWDPAGLDERVLKDLLLFVLAPWTLALAHRRQLGWRVDRRALRNAAALGLFVLPFYVVGSTLPTVRAYYPVWRTSLALTDFLPHAVSLVLVALAAETYYRGLLCVGLRELGPASWFVSPLAYALVHLGKPPVELLLSGPTDVLFGAVDYYSDSIFPSVVAHGGGLVLLDWLVLHEPVVAPGRVVAWLSWLPVPL